MATEPGGRSLLVRWWWLHPLLIAAFPVLFLFAENIGEQVSLEPLAASIGGAGLLQALVAGVARLGGGQAARGALVASLVIALFFAYGHVWPIVEEGLRLHRNLLVIWAALAAGGTLAALLAPMTAVRAATAGLNVAALVLVTLNVVPIVWLQFTGDRSVETGPVASARSGAALDGPRPDIWYLVFDRYAGQDALSTVYGFDNGPFLRELEERGFRIVEHATANYLKTAQSLASSMAMDYLDTGTLAGEATGPDDWTPLYRRIQESYPVERYLHEREYRYLHLGVRRGATYTNAAADRVFLYTDHTEFSAVLVDTTMLVALENVVEDDTPLGRAGLYGRSTLYQLNVLDQLAAVRSDAPQFVFAHFLLPHLPYVFNADGSWVTEAQAEARDSREEYLEQLGFANARILRFLDILLAGAADGEGPVVLIQADEGPYPPRLAADEAAFDWTTATEEELLEKFSILAAYRVPATATTRLQLPSTTTPVNSFRLILNAVFDAELPLLPDRNFAFRTPHGIYDLVDVTDRVASAVR